MYIALVIFLAKANAMVAESQLLLMRAAFGSGRGGYGGGSYGGGSYGGGSYGGGGRNGQDNRRKFFFCYLLDVTHETRSFCS